MKKGLALLLFSGFYAIAQDVSPQCEQLIRETDSLLGIVEYDKAIANWQKSKEICANTSAEVYSQGTTLLRRELDMATAGEAKKAAAKNLLAHYAEQQKHFPKLDRAIAVKRALLMREYEVGSPMESYALLDEMFRTRTEYFHDPEGLFAYFSLYFDRYKNGDKTVTLAKILEKRDALDMHFAALSDGGIYKRVSSSISALVDPEIDCTKLASYYKEVKPSREKDTLWLDIASKRLYDKQCFEAPELLELAQAAYALRPSVSNAYTLGLLMYRSGKSAQAAQYFETSANLETDSMRKAETLFTVASSVYMGSDYAKVVEFANKASKADSRFTKAHLLLAQTYASAGKNCTDDDFEKRALNWLAINEVKKAIALQPSLESSMRKLIGHYEKSAPGADEIKSRKMGGKAISYGCWINQTVIVPKK